MASVWFTAYPASIITREGESVLATLGDPDLWRTFAEIGIEGMHTGPLKQSGGIYEQEYTPTIDGFFDRIGLDIAPDFGTTAEYLTMRQNASANGAILIDDIVPAHTGKGADFRLAERGYNDYPGLYHMVEIAREDWYLLPDVGKTATRSTSRPASWIYWPTRATSWAGYARVIFYEPGIKETDWSATDVVRGVDGVERRWVYLHYFKAGQPTLNWLDPSFAAQRLVIGGALRARHARRQYAAPGRQRFPGHRAQRRRHGLVRRASTFGGGQPAHRRDGAQGGRLYLPGTQPGGGRYRAWPRVAPISRTIL
ncbi:MAG: hypothetical protein R2856_35155 [Caldilineaceae bacterium]